MLKKKKVENVNIYDNHYSELYVDFLRAKNILQECAIDVIIKTNVINLYPEGPDKIAAEKDAEEAKRLLLCAIGNYDCRLQEAKDYWKNNFDKLESQVYNNPNRAGTSHFWIERAYKEFFENKR